MEYVIDTSSLSWIERIGKLDLLIQLYESIYAPPGVYRELSTHIPTKKFVEEHVKPITFRDEKERRKFDRLVKRWTKKVDLEDVTDIQVFVGYRYFSEANEALYANKRAEDKLIRYGNVRDIGRLFELAEAQNLFTRADTREFLECFLKLNCPYRPKYI